MLPILKTDEPVCPEGKLSCGNGECIDKELFCNGKPDCKDESDENSCSKYSIKFSVEKIKNSTILSNIRFLAYFSIEVSKLFYF